jgi:hypothetical protein
MEMVATRYQWRRCLLGMAKNRLRTGADHHELLTVDHAEFGEKARISVRIRALSPGSLEEA